MARLIAVAILLAAVTPVRADAGPPDGTRSLQEMLADILDPTRVAYSILPGDALPELVGRVAHHETRHSDTLLDVARANGLGYIEMIVANPGVDPWLPGEGTEVMLPTAHLLPVGARQGILINLGDQRLYFFPGGGEPAVSYPIGIGREGWSTPLGRTTVVRKQEKPTWYPPDSVRAEKPELPEAVPPGPANPLGDYALYLGWPSYLVHGTNRPWGVGRRVSHGCIRLYPEDIADLFGRVPIGTPVEVVDQPVKFAWLAGELYMEAHPEPAQIAALEATGRFDPAPLAELDTPWLTLLAEKAGNDLGRLDWELIKRELGARRGLPVRITKPAGGGDWAGSMGQLR